MKKKLTLVKKMFLSLVVIIGAISIAYLLIAMIALAGMLDGGGTGLILEWMKSPIFSGILFGSVIWMAFLKKTRQRFIR